jgi:GNAT superfamily N-acetyltransferase
MVTERLESTARPAGASLADTERMAHHTIRPARGDEVPAVLVLYEWLFEPPGYKPSGWNPDGARAALAAAIAGERSAVLVAERDEELVGVLTAYLDLNSVRFGLRCWVEDLVVDPACRSEGVGKRLLDAAKLWAKQCGATHLELDTGLARTNAQQFYDREQPTAKGYSYSWTL